MPAMAKLFHFQIERLPLNIFNAAQFS